MNIETFGKVYSALSQNEAGRSLMDTYRWSQFRTNESNDEWHELFGATGQVFTHSQLFWHLSRWFLQKEQGRFTPKKEEMFLYGTAPHDLGEAKIKGKGVGDVSAMFKTRDDERRESKMARLVISSLLITDELKTKLIDGYDSVVNGKDPELHFAFKALEKSEYVFTAMKVYQNSKKMEAQGKKGLELLKPLVGRVLVFDLTKVLDVYAPVYVNSIGEIFKKSSRLIDEMFVYSMPWLLTQSRWQDKSVDHASLARTFVSKWEEFKNS